ncbi:unnamed protein product [Lymnaea stagnalis]|uniref:Uncharacterized protein n=1 Tax=Lymnaea stagnalis TaxID=6523 RepID=A0AAV2I013_LYMST
MTNRNLVLVSNWNISHWCVTRLTGVVTRLTGVVTRLTGVVTRLTGVVTRLTGVVTRLTGVVTRLTGVVTRLTGVFYDVEMRYDDERFFIVKQKVSEIFITVHKGFLDIDSVHDFNKEMSKENCIPMSLCITKYLML